MLNISTTDGSMDQAVEEMPNTLGAALMEMNSELLKVMGLSTSIRHLGESLPNTALENEDTFCHELVLPCLAQAACQHIDRLMSLVERATSLCTDKKS